MSLSQKPSPLFTLKALDGRARRGHLDFDYAYVETPAFMPVGTLGSVKAIYPSQIEEAGADMILANAYHLSLRPSAERVARLGGLHSMMGWHKPILTDSGGFQIMSLAKKVKITQEGAMFQSHLDGQSHHLTPERAMEIQKLLGSDIHMVLDQCIALPASEDEVKDSVLLSLDWAKRSKIWALDNASKPPKPPKPLRRKRSQIFGIVQGGLSPYWRAFSAEKTLEIGFDGYAIGGLSVGESQHALLAILDEVLPLLPDDKPRYLMGVGRPSDLVLAIERGVDMFDCVLPTREARHGRAYTSDGVLNLRNAVFADDKTLLDKTLSIEASQMRRGYIHHLFQSHEMLGQMILTWNNIAFYQKLMRDCRNAIERGQFESFKQSLLVIYPPA